MLCGGQTIVDFTHFLPDYFIGTRPIARISDDIVNDDDGDDDGDDDDNDNDDDDDDDVGDDDNDDSKWMILSLLRCFGP